MKYTKVAIVGAGNMGMTYAKAMLKFDFVSADTLLLVEANPERAATLRKEQSAKVIAAFSPEIGETEVVIVAVKPQDFAAVAQQLKTVLKENQIVLSVMAGISIATMEEQLNHKKIIRSMPNTPAQIGMGVTAFVAADGATKDHVRLIEKLLSTTGREVYVETEDMIDAVTGVSGSGPAYFYYIVKAMIEAGKEMGLDEVMSSLLVQQTMLGAYHLMKNSEMSLDELIAVVKSKGGTTEAALNTFETEGVSKGLKEGMKAAKTRAAELSELLGK